MMYIALLYNILLLYSYNYKNIHIYLWVPLTLSYMIEGNPCTILGRGGTACHAEEQSAPPCAHNYGACWLGGVANASGN